MQLDVIMQLKSILVQEFYIEKNTVTLLFRVVCYCRSTWTSKNLSSSAQKNYFLFYWKWWFNGSKISASSSQFVNGSLDSCEELETKSAKISCII
jgi:hypothetical protein